MEDQSTDTSDLTETGDESREPDAETTRASAATPVGKRGRHRSFRPRPVAPAEDETAETSDAQAANEPAETASEEPTEPAPKAKRRNIFRRRGKAEPEEVSDPDAEVTEEETEVKVRRPVGRRLAVAAAVAGVLFVAAGAFAGAMLQPYLADRVTADTKLDIARTATKAITTLFTYTPDDMDQLPARSEKYLGGDLKETYAKQVDALAATNKQNQIHRSAEVVGAAVESLNGTQATAIVYANVSYTSASTKDVPKLFLVSYRLSMQRKGSDWVIVNMPWITSKDLTKIT